MSSLLSKLQSSAALRFGLYGTLFGICFPLFAVLFDLYMRELPFTFSSALVAHTTQPLLWIIDTAPVVLGLFARLAGISHDRLAKLNSKLETLVEVRTINLQQANAALEQEIEGRKQIETQLRAATAEAETANRAKSMFLANMSHEIRTPMNGVLGMIDLLEQTELTDTQRHFARTVHSSADTLLTIINDILDLSKIEAGKFELEHTPFDLRVMVEEIAERYSEAAARQGLEIACHIPHNIATHLEGDAHRLQQVLGNLVSNAIKFTFQGEVTIRVSLLEDTEEHAMIRFAVHDTGIGIAPDVYESIFRAFSQADGSTTRKYGGTGLGLTIAKQISALLGGEIGVESVVGTGSTFWFSARLSKSTSVLPNLAALQDLSGLRVLVVDDNATNREILQHQLSTWGIASDLAAIGPEGLQMLRAAVAASAPYDIAILDMQMPVMDGIELAQTIKADPAIAAVRLVMLTSISQFGDIQAARAAGIEAYLSKPARQSELYNSLINVLATASAAPPIAVSTSPSQKADIATRPDSPAPTAPLQILVVEDNRINQQILRAMLEFLGHRLEIADNGKIGLELLARRTYDLILMDCQMPEMDGFEATQRIRSDALAAATLQPRIPIIALTANALQGDRERCLAAGMDDYLSKPFTHEQLQAVLTRWR
jgi:two-component system, sensor histidine kinase and response regulator